MQQRLLSKPLTSIRPQARRTLATSTTLPPPRATHLLYRDIRATGKDPELAVGAKGSYLTLDDGRQILDACAGAAVASIGHADQRVIDAVMKQMKQLSYHHTSRLTNPAAEELASVLLGDKPGGLSNAIFLSSGSEANESAMKLARQYFVEKGEPERVNFISRTHSYHGNGIGAVSLTGIPNRRGPYEPLLMDSVSRVENCYPYRLQRKGESDAAYAKRLAEDLEDEILRLGPKTVVAFVAETVGGAAAGTLTSVSGYFREIRKVCDKYGVLLILDEIMSGMGRCGTMHAWEAEGVTPDIQTIGKGLNGGYQALSAVLIAEHVTDVFRAGTGTFINGQTFQCHPAAAAAGLAVMDIFKTDKILENCVSRGEQLYNGLVKAVGSHPNVGEIRGRGLFRSIEFVKDKSTKSTFPVTLPLAAMLDDAIFDLGVSVYSGFGKGTADGVRGDHILFSPPLNISKEEVEVCVKAVKEGIEKVFESDRVREAMEA
ncbi:hypothetical protein MNV49_006943 [Pseudohyphozyma bogoriensis]|nr:hypothetical protein MNV49_006943 [Pseudohyphozyma bogoriensis]